MLINFLMRLWLWFCGLFSAPQIEQQPEPPPADLAPLLVFELAPQPTKTIIRLGRNEAFRRDETGQTRVI